MSLPLDFALLMAKPTVKHIKLEQKHGKGSLTKSIKHAKKTGYESLTDRC